MVVGSSPTGGTIRKSADVNRVLLGLLKRNMPVDMMKTQPTGVVRKSCKQPYHNEGEVIEKFPRHRGQEEMAHMVSMAEWFRR